MILGLATSLGAVAQTKKSTAKPAGKTAPKAAVAKEVTTPSGLKYMDLVVGTGARASGTYLQLGGDGVTVTTGGAHLILRVRTTVVRAIPASARFRLTATDDFGQSASVARAIAKPVATGGFAWGEMAAFVAIALFAGGFLGNLVASKRRPPARPSVYAAIQRRMQEERPQEPSRP